MHEFVFLLATHGLARLLNVEGRLGGSNAAESLHRLVNVVELFLDVKTLLGVLGLHRLTERGVSDARRRALPHEPLARSMVPDSLSARDGSGQRFPLLVLIKYVVQFLPQFLVLNLLLAVRQWQ